MSLGCDLGKCHLAFPPDVKETLELSGEGKPPNPGQLR